MSAQAPGPAAESPGQDATRPPWAPADLFPFAPRFVEVAGARLHYVDEGTGPPLLVLHGNPTWSFLYRGLIARLKARFRCLAVDYPGFGLSAAPAGYGFTAAEHARVVREFVRALDLRGLVLMGQDWGGPIGLWAAAHERERMRALVLANTWGWPVNGDFHFEWFSRALGGPLGAALIRRFNLFVNLGLPLGVRRAHLSPRVMAAYRGPFPTPESRRPTHVFPREITRARALLAEVEAGLARLADLPALIVWGDADIAFRAKERRRFESCFPRHETVILKGAGHFVQEDAPGEIAAAIASWWDRGASKAAPPQASGEKRSSR